MLFTRLAWLTCALGASATQQFIPSEVLKGPTTPESISQPGNFDGIKLTPGNNATSYDWWYFDAVSPTTNESIVIVFYNAGPDAIDVPRTAPLYVQITGVFANGTRYALQANATGGANFQNNEHGISSVWNGAGSSFAGTNLDADNVEYTVTIDNSAIGLKGTLGLKAVSRPHYPCDLNKPGVTEELIPHVFWANAVPDADATVDFTIHGTPVRFTGLGYHDKNWGDLPHIDAFNTWYWGHARLGPYSLVWFDTLSTNGKEYFSSWITKDGQVVTQSCQQNSVVVRPWGENSLYPPTLNLPAPSGLTMRYDLGSQGAFVANFTREITSVPLPNYKRFTGSIVGGFEGGEQYEGHALGEQFQFGR
ncbi:hypothetical protein PspLS_12127 [Pyricularia sp. CBS 133598]|nr:hypothetical protein PspLS_12127 [Pyricularia sp. CBS 133598]